MKSRGGWEVKKIWELTGHIKGFYCIHKPGTEDESVPVFHHPDGRACTAFSINEAPVYGQHPADIVDFTEENTIKEKAFSSNKPDSGLIIGPVSKSDIEFTIGPVPELFIKIDSVGKIFGKGGRFIGTLTEEELKLFYKSVPLQIKVPTQEE